MQHLFSSVPRANIPRSMFNRPFNLKTTIGTDYLYPIYVDEALPGDTFRFSGNLFGRLSTPVVPLMDNLYLDVFFFAVPIRLLDDNFRRVMGEKPFGDVSTDYAVPQMWVEASPGSLSDYLGLPQPLNGAGYKVCPYWHRAYNLIWNEWFRDENLCEPRPIAGLSYDGTQVDEAESQYVLLKRCKRHDYFTSALPWPQKGDPVSISLAGNIPVVGNGNAIGVTQTSGASSMYLMRRQATSAPVNGLVDLTTQVYSAPPSVGSSISGTFGVTGTGTAQTTNLALGLSTDPSKSGIVADASSIGVMTVNQFREAVAIQRLLERDSMGTRLIEIIRNHFGVISPDARMQRPEYLGGSSQVMTITSVPQTSASVSGSAQGNLAAYCTVGSGCSWIKSFTEHCVIIGLANVRADLSYQQGVPRMFLRKTRYDFYWPALANLGEQGIYNIELYASGADNPTQDQNAYGDYAIFGYQERWAEYRYHPNMITGKFRSYVSGTLDYWHLAQEFDDVPTLSADFIEENVPIGRVVAVPSEPPVILDGYFDVHCARPMPLYSVPSISNRF